MIKLAVNQYQMENLSSWDEYVKKITLLITQAKNANVNLLLLPEYAGVEIGGHHETDLQLYKSIQALIPKYRELFQDFSVKHKMYIQPGTVIEEISPNYFVNRAYFFAPNGKIGYQDKLQLTAFEKNLSVIQRGQQQTLFETAFGKIGIAICYDSEFPEIVRRLVFAGASLILVPSYTTSLAGYYRVSLSCRARALENQCYVATAFMVGTDSLSGAPEETMGYAAVFSPVDTGFPDDGIITQCASSNPAMMLADLDCKKLDDVRENGQVHNFKDIQMHNEFIKQEIHCLAGF